MKSYIGCITASSIGPNKATKNESNRNDVTPDAFLEISLNPLQLTLIRDFFKDISTCIKAKKQKKEEFNEKRICATRKR